MITASTLESSTGSLPRAGSLKGSLLKLDMSEKLYLVCYTDDFAALVVVSTAEDAQSKLGLFMRREREKFHLYFKPSAEKNRTSHFE